MCPSRQCFKEIFDKIHIASTVRYRHRKFVPYEAKHAHKKNAAIARIFKTVKVTKVGDVNLTRRIYPHLLRHTFATTFLENGGNIYALQQILGHTTLDMVKNYVHLTQAKTVVNFDKYSPLDNLN